MGIFRKHDPELSDEALLLTPEESNEMQEQSGADQQQESEDAPTETQEAAAQQESPTQLPPQVRAEREMLWRKAAEAVSADWPQAMGQGKALIGKMTEISAAYGDPLLWQRAPEGIMREAAIQLFGLPKVKDSTYAKLAAEAARAGALEEMRRRDQAKAGLSKGRHTEAGRGKTSPEQQIMEQIAAAKKNSIF